MPFKSAFTTIEIPSLDVKMYCSTYDRILYDVQVIVDTRDHEWEDFEDLNIPGKKVIKFPVRPRYEPLIRDEFHHLYHELLLDIKEGRLKKVQFIDYNGSSSGAMFIWVLYYKLGELSLNDSFDLITEAYQKQNNVVGLTAPRYARQILFARWYMTNNAWGAMTEQIRLTTNHKLKRKVKNGEIGKLRINALRRPKPCCLYLKHSFLPDFVPVLLDSGYNKKNEWMMLNLDFMGPYSFTSYDITGQKIEETSHSLLHLMYANWVFEDDFDTEKNDGSLKPEWYTLHQKLIAQRDPILCHPKGRIDQYGIHLEPKYFMWEGKLVPYCDAKVTIFSRLYAAKARETLYYKSLVNLRQTGANLYLLSYGAFDFVEEGLTFKEYYDIPNKDKTWGIACVLYGMMMGEEYWNQ